MLKVTEWITANWQMVIPVGVLLVILSLSGNITETIRAAKKGLKEFMTPLGFVVTCGLAYVAYKIYLSIMETL